MKHKLVIIITILLGLSVGDAHAEIRLTLTGLHESVAEGDYMKAYDIAAGLPTTDDRTYIEWAGYHAPEIPSVMLYIMGQRLFKISRYDGLRWLTLGRLRLWQDLDICDINKDHGNAGAMILDVGVQEIIDYRLSYPKAAIDATHWAISWDEDHAHKANPGWNYLVALNMALATRQRPLLHQPSPVKAQNTWPTIRKASNRIFLDRQIKLSGG